MPKGRLWQNILRESAVGNRVPGQRIGFSTRPEPLIGTGAL